MLLSEAPVAEDLVENMAPATNITVVVAKKKTKHQEKESNEYLSQV